MKYFLLFALLIQSSNLLAEVIKGPADIRPGIHEDIVLTLNDGVQVSCTRLLDGWYQISFSIKISEEKYNSQDPVRKGEKLIGWDNNVIGLATNDIPFSKSYSWTSGGAPGNPKRYGMQIFGFAKPNNIYEWSIPENPLNQILAKKGSLTLSVFSEYFNKFEFRKIGYLETLMPTLTEYMIYENDIDDPSPIDRLRFIFEEQTLIAIVHSRELKTPDWKTEQIVRDLKLTVFTLPKGIDRETFIRINNKSYNGVD